MRQDEEHARGWHLSFCAGRHGHANELPENEPGHQETDMVHEAGLQSIGHLQKERKMAAITLENHKKRCPAVALS